MFTGLIEELGTIRQIEFGAGDSRLTITGPLVAADARIGDSVAISGCCLTVIETSATELVFEAGPETLERTTLNAWRVGDFVNVERSLCVGGRLGGHFVTGHVDGIGVLDERMDQGEWSTMRFRCDPQLSLQMASKGSIAVDGVSLTLVDVASGTFSVALIPHTMAMTTLGQLVVGGRVNLETDVLAKYVQRQLNAVSAAPNIEKPPHA